MYGAKYDRYGCVTYRSDTKTWNTPYYFAEPGYVDRLGYEGYPRS